MKSIIVYRLGSLGDTVVALPCLNKIVRSFPNEKRILLTNFPVSSKAAPLQAILGDNRMFQESIAYPIGTRSISKLWRLARTIRASKARTLIYLMPARGPVAALRDLVFFRLCGIRRIIGLSFRDQLRSASIEYITGVEERECERLVRTMRELGPIDLNSLVAWNLALTSEEMQAAEQILDPLAGRPFFALNMGGKAPAKDWGADRWRQLLRALAEFSATYGILVVGAAEEAERAEMLASEWRNIVVNACGRLSPRESAAALERATIFIGHDSGPLHLAAARGVRCIGLFGNLNRPNKWHPYGEMHRIFHDMRGMSEISAADVAAVAAGWLSAKERARA